MSSNSKKIDIPDFKAPFLPKDTSTPAPNFAEKPAHLITSYPNAPNLFDGYYKRSTDYKFKQGYFYEQFLASNNSAKNSKSADAMISGRISTIPRSATVTKSSEGQIILS